MPKVTTSGLVLVVCLALTACGGDNSGGGGDKTFEGEHYSFTYPGDWDELDVETRSETGTELAYTYVGPGGANQWGVTVYPHHFSVTAENIDEFEPEITQEVRTLFQDLEGELATGPTSVTINGLPGIRWEGSLVNVNDVSVRSRFTSLFDGRTEYWLNCQFTPEHAGEMKRGCDQVEDSFQVE